MRRLALLLLLLTPLASWAELKIGGELKVDSGKLVRLSATGQADNATLDWQITPEDTVDPEEFGPRVVFAAPDGTYKIRLRAFSIDKNNKITIQFTKATVVIGTPTPPAPPTPPTPPDPPEPPPPIEGVKAPKALKVLIVYESGELSKMSKDQVNVLYAKAIRDYLNSKCDKEASGKAAWRIWDKDIDAAADLPEWGKAIKRDRKQVPWIVIANHKTGYEGPLPATTDATLALLKKYGGV